MNDSIIAGAILGLIVFVACGFYLAVWIINRPSRKKPGTFRERYMRDVDTMRVLNQKNKEGNP